jgi:hypothetical protein
MDEAEAKMNYKKLLIISLIFLIVAGVAFRFLSINKDITGEETDFVKPALALQETGKSTYYHSGQQPNQTGLLHPPMYILTLSVLLNNSFLEASARFPNVAFSLLTALLIYLFCVNLISRKNNKIIGLIASTLFLVNYYVLSMSLTIDIDMFSTFFTFAFLYSMLMFSRSRENIYLALAGILLFCSIFNRYPIAFLVFVSLGVYYLVNRELRKDFKRYFLVGFFAGAAFFAVWAVYSTVIEPGTFLSFFEHNARLGSENLSSLGVYLGSFALNISQFIRLFTLPAVILMILSFVYFMKTAEKPIKSLLIYSLSILVLFTFISRPAFGYPRYFMTLFPGVCILISLFVYEVLQGIKLERKTLLLIVSSFAISLLILLLLFPQGAFYQSNGLIKATNLPDFAFNLLASLPLVFAIFAKGRKKMAILILCALLLSYSLYFDINYVAHNSHIKETANYLNERTSANDLVIAPKAVGFYLHSPFYVNDYTKPPMNFSTLFLKEYFIKSLENREMSDEFFWEKGYFGGINLPRPSQETLNSAKYAVLYHPVDNLIPEKQIGEFYIYNLKG